MLRRRAAAQPAEEPRPLVRRALLAGPGVQAPPAHAPAGDRALAVPGRVGEERVLARARPPLGRAEGRRASREVTRGPSGFGYSGGCPFSLVVESALL